MNTIGITGAIGHGKSTFAEALITAQPDIFYIESSHIISEVADEFHKQMPRPPQNNNIEWMNEWVQTLPGILKDTVSVDVLPDTLQFSEASVVNNPNMYLALYRHAELVTKDPGLAEQSINPENKSNYRSILQWLGGYAVKKVSPTIWYDEIVRRVQDSNAETAIVGGLRFQSDELCLRKAFDTTIVDIYRPGAPEQSITDPTEAERSKIAYDVRIINAGSKQALQDIAPVFLDHLQDKTMPHLFVTDNKKIA